MEGNAVFLVLLLLLFVVRHVFSLVQFAFLLTSTASSTLHLQALVAAPQERKLLKVIDVLIIVSLNIWALSLLGLPDSSVWRAAHLRAPKESLSVRAFIGP
jgi:Na+-transporting methylmalonyl-CoA/oxaloacetate decarboxylase gamma subunit